MGQRPRLWDASRGRLKAKGTGHKAKTIKANLSSPYALRPKPLLLAKPSNSDLTRKTRFSILNKALQQRIMLKWME
jgi:hypothetical protein